MIYDFDTFYDRRGTASLKFDFAKERHRPEDVLSYWVADMDFPTAQEIIDALVERSRHGIFGYTDVKPPYYETVAAWYEKRFGYKTEREWLCVTPGIVMAIGLAIQAFTKEGDSVLIQNPVYYPFSGTVRAARRNLVTNTLVWQNGRYCIDFDALERQIQEHKVALFLLCNPHNPGGTSWTKEELLRLGELCLAHNVIVLSDEIHSDFVWAPHTHTVFASLSKELEQQTITCTSPTKAFNLAGLQVSNIFIANETLRARFQTALDAVGYSQPNTMGLTACQAAYTHGEDWLLQVKAYIQKNLERSVQQLKKSGIPVNIAMPEATYLLWIDCSKLGLEDKTLNHILTHEAKLWLDAGRIFGQEGLCFERINVATAWAYLTQGLTRFTETLGAHYNHSA